MEEYMFTYEDFETPEIALSEAVDALKELQDKLIEGLGNCPLYPLEFNRLVSLNEDTIRIAEDALTSFVHMKNSVNGRIFK